MRRRYDYISLNQRLSNKEDIFFCYLLKFKYHLTPSKYYLNLLINVLDRVLGAHKIGLLLPKQQNWNFYK